MQTAVTLYKAAVFTAPADDAGISGVLEAGTQLTVLSQHGAYAQVSWSGGQGWVQSGAIRMSGASSQPNYPQSPGQAPPHYGQPNASSFSQRAAGYQAGVSDQFQDVAGKVQSQLTAWSGGNPFPILVIFRRVIWVVAIIIVVLGLITGIGLASSAFRYDQLGAIVVFLTTLLPAILAAGGVLVLGEMVRLFMTMEEHMRQQHDLTKNLSQAMDAMRSDASSDRKAMTAMLQQLQAVRSAPVTARESSDNDDSKE